MTKKEFENFIKENLEGLPLHKQEELLRKIAREWLPSIREKFSKKVSKKYLKCSNCGKYSLIDDYSSIWVEELNKGQLVYSDCGYGDDDEYADVLYNVNYLVCPLCKKNNFKEKWYISESNRRGRT